MEHTLPTTQVKTLQIDITRWSIQKSDSLYLLQTKMENLYTGSGKKTGSCLVAQIMNTLLHNSSRKNHWSIQFCSVQLLSYVQLFAIPWTSAHQTTLSITNSRSPPIPMSTESVMPSNHLILCRPLLLPLSIFPTIRVFSNESALHIRWPKDWSFSFNISPSSEYPGLISSRMGWLDFLAVQGTLKSLLQHHTSKASILQC